MSDTLEATVTTKLIRRGDRLFLRIDHEHLEALGVDENTSLSVTAEAGSIVIRVVTDEERRQRFEAALQDTVEKYDGMLRRLAQ